MFFTPVTLSRNQHKTPEGFLVCLGAAIARTGKQLYDESELDVEPGPDGKIWAYREDDEVFHPDAIASAEGKDVVVTHPVDDVTPENWMLRTQGHMQNVRRGTGTEDHLLLADLVIKHPDAIDLIEQNPNHQLSLGYEARYEIMGPGRVNQCQIRINHVALVPAGRCGPVCATRDHMPDVVAAYLKNPVTIRPDACGCDRSLAAKTGDSMTQTQDAEVKSDSVLSKTGNPDENETHTHVHLHLGSPHITKPEGGLPSTGEQTVTNAADSKTVGGETDATMGGKSFWTDEAISNEFKNLKDAMKDGFETLTKKIADAFPEKKETKDGVEGEESAKEEPAKEIEGELEEEAPPGTGDAKKHKDSAFLEESFGATVAGAIVLVPGIAIPTFDRASDPAATYGNVCALRRKALIAYMATTDGAATIKELSGPAGIGDISTMKCRDVAPIFRGAVVAQKAKNNLDAFQKTQDGSVFGKTHDAEPEGGIQSLSDLQRVHEKFNAIHNPTNVFGQ